MRIELFKKVCANFNKEPNEELYLLWNEQLEDYDPYYLEIAVGNIIRNDNYFPTISRILEELKKIPLKEIPTSEKIRRMKERGIEPEWVDKVFEEEMLDEEDEETFKDFQNFIEELRGEDNDEREII